MSIGLTPLILCLAESVFDIQTHSYLNIVELKEIRPPKAEEPLRRSRP